jgi:hypothetical protein
MAELSPPPELVQQWVAEIWHEGTPVRVPLRDEHVATKAAQWGANQELEACCTEVSFWGSKGMAEKLRAARRPKSQSLKEEALHQLEAAERLWPADWSAIRKALNQLPDNGANQ